MAGNRSSLRRRLRQWRRVRRGRRRPGALALPRVAGYALALALPVAATASPAPTGWGPPREISDGSSSPLGLAATAGVDGSGNAVVLWHADAGVESVLRSAGRGFGSPRAIPGSRLSMPDLRPRLAFDAKGAALAVWSYFEPHPRFVQDGYAVDYTFGLRVAGRTAHSTFGAAQTLTDKLDADPSADVAFDPRGTAVVIWTDQAGMHAAARPAGKRRFSRAQVISQTQADPQVAVGASGSAVAAWAGQSHGTWSVRAAVAERGKAFGVASKLPIAGLGNAKPVVAVDGRSAVTAAWASRGRVMAATCSASGHCGSAQALSPAGQAASDPRVAVAPDGTAVVAWRSQAGVAASLRRGHSPFGTPGTLASLAKGERATGLAGAVGPHGDAATLWTIHAADGDRVEGALRHGSGARFARASRLSGPVAHAAWSDPQVVVAPSGSALAVWGALIDGRPSIQAAAYDPAR
jgi:hypothetical protein